MCGVFIWWFIMSLIGKLNTLVDKLELLRQTESQMWVGITSVTYREHQARHRGILSLNGTWKCSIKFFSYSWIRPKPSKHSHIIKTNKNPVTVRKYHWALTRIQSRPGKRILWRTISPIMHPTDHISTACIEVSKRKERKAMVSVKHVKLWE